MYLVVELWDVYNVAVMSESIASLAFNFDARARLSDVMS